MSLLSSTPRRLSFRPFAIAPPGLADASGAPQPAADGPGQITPRTELPSLQGFARGERLRSFAGLLPRPAVALALFLLVLLATGSADGQSLVAAPGSTTVGQQTAMTSISVTATVGGQLASPVAYSNGVDSSNTTKPEFSITYSSCGQNQSMTAGQACTFTVGFTPQYPGWRTGALVLQATDGSALGQVQLGGMATGPLPVLFPGLIQTVAGNSQWIYHGDGVAAISAPIFLPTGIAVDAAGNLFLSDSNNNRIRRVDASTGLISTVAGTGDAGYSGDNGPAAQATVNTPAGMALDGAGNLYFSDAGNEVVRRIDAFTGVITTVAGTPTLAGFTGDNGPATQARLTNPQGVAFDLQGNLLIADTGNAAVRKVSNGTITTIAGTGTPGYNGDARSATTAQLNNPWNLAVRTDGAIAVADLSNHRVRLIDMTGTISTVAGNGTRGFAGDGSPATQAELNGPAAVAFDPAGDLLIADSGNNRIRLVPTTPTNIMTISGGDSEQFSGDGGPSNVATMYGPYALTFTAAGDLFFADMFHNRIRQISGSQLPILYPTMRVSKTSAPIEESVFDGGNAPLNWQAPIFDQSALDMTQTTCSTGTALTPSVFCNLYIEFVPTQVGPSITGSLSLPSDALNVTPVYTVGGPVLSVEPTTIALSSSANPSLTSTPITFTATVSSDDPNASGTVDFLDGSTVLCKAIGLNKMTAVCTVGTLALGSHSLTAVYSGDDNNASSTSAVLTEVIKQQPALALSASTSPATVAQTITLTLSAASASGTPTGAITFYDGTVALGTANLNAQGIAQISTSKLTVGTHPLTGQYAGDTSNMNGTSNTVNEEIDQATTVTVIASSGSSITVGSALTLSATVVSPNGPAPTGSVTFKDGATSLGTVTVQADGTASLVVNSLTPGSHGLVATYGSDANDSGSSSSSLSVTVNQIATVTTIGADASPLSAGATLHLTAIVAIAPGATASGALSGTVTFKDGATVLGTANLNATGQATLGVSTLTVGTHTITANFGGATNYAASASTGLTEPVQSTPTTVAVLSAVQTVLEGMPASSTVAVSSQTGTPTGTVSLKEGATVLGTATLDAQGHTSFSVSTLAVGSHTLVVSYAGDSNYNGSNSPSFALTVNLATPSLALTGPTGTVDAGVTLTFAAALTSPGVAPTGTVTLLDGSAVLGTQLVSAAGTFNFPLSTLSLGSHTLTVKYSGDKNNAAAVSGALTVTVQTAPTATGLGASVNPVTLGNTTVLTAAVTSDSPNPTGTITFSEGPTALGTGTLDASGHATISLSTLALGNHPITAAYGGDAKHAASTSVVLQELVVASDVATLSSSLNPSASGQSVTFTASVSGGNGLVPTGAITFADNGQVLATVPLDGNGHASMMTTALAVGTHAVSISYAGDQHFAAAKATLTQTVTNASTRISLTASANPATYGQPVALTATVVSNGGMATGQIVFTDGTATVGTGTLDATGTAVLTTTKLTPGTHAIVANYPGDGRASASVSTPLSLEVEQTVTVALAANPNPAQTLAAITLTATVVNAGATTPTGTVTFNEGATVLGTAAVGGSGHATFSVPQMSAGKHNLTAIYGGDTADFAATSGAIIAEVDLRPTAVSLTGSSTDPANPQQVTLIAVVRSPNGAANTPPTGAVTFTSGNITLGQANVDTTGVATLTVIFENPTEKVNAAYAGDSNYSAASSGETSITAGQAPQFTMALDHTNVTLVSTQHTVLNVTVTSMAGFNDMVQFGCMGLPYAATCTFSQPSSKLAANGQATVQMTLDTGDPLGAGTGVNASVDGLGSKTIMAVLPFAGLLALFGRRRKGLGKGLGGIALAALFTLTALGAGAVLTGCGGLHTTGTPPGTYTFKVVGTGLGSGATESQIVTLVVTQ